MAQQKDNSGVIFQNDKKLKDTDPDGKGSATIDGVSYWVASWVNTSREGVPYKSLRFTRKDQQGGGQQGGGQQGGGQQGGGQQGGGQQGGGQQRSQGQAATSAPRPTKQQATADAQRYQSQRAIPPQDARQAPTAAAPARQSPARKAPPPPIQEQEPAGPPGEETHFTSEDIPFSQALA